MLNRIKAILGENSLCVLATCSENRPHCSLMAYSYDIQENILYMMTLKTTQKYRNIRHNSQVSVLSVGHPFDGFFAYGWGAEVTSFFTFQALPLLLPIE